MEISHRTGAGEFAGTSGKAASFARAVAIAKRIVAEQHDRPSLVSRIACEIAAEITEDLRHPGDDLNSVELARRYQTSRTPIREALMLLEKEGLVEMPPRRRPRVASPSIPEIREIYRVRASLLQLVATDIATSVPLEEIATLEPMLQRMHDAVERGDLGAFYWANVDFHERNTELPGNRMLKRIIDSLILRTLRLKRIALSQPHRLERSLDDHQRLYKAYRERDAILAGALIRSTHISGLAEIERAYEAREARGAGDGSRASRRARTQ